MKSGVFAALVLTGFAVTVAASAEEAFSLALPVDCTLNETCFLQQYPDMDTSPGVADPFCGTASYDGHKGTDIRLSYFDDIAADVAVLAAAPGTVLRIRDGVEDRLARTREDMAAVASIECGNGLLISHDGGWETQYCHLKKGSISVAEGDTVEAGTPLGAVGSSGLSQFAHVHLEVRKDGETIDPFTGQRLGAQCRFDGNRVGTLWSPTAEIASVAATQIMDIGLAAGPVDHDRLAISPPPPPGRDAAALVGWASVINLQEDDRIGITVRRPDGGLFAEQVSEPMDRPKASYSLFAGRRGRPQPGTYEVEVRILRKMLPVATMREEFSVQ